MRSGREAPDLLQTRPTAGPAVLEKLMFHNFINPKKSGLLSSIAKISSPIDVYINELILTLKKSYPN